jgi:hypothetical protein
VHHKHKRPRAGRESHMSQTYWRAKRGLTPVKLPKDWPKLLVMDTMDERRRVFWPRQFRSMASYPRAWDIIMHTRPRRAQEKRLARAVQVGKLDPDAALWPLEKKPHRWYY